MPAPDDPLASVGDSLPTGTVTFLFTDIEGSTRLLERLGEGYAKALAVHHRLLRVTFAAHGGRELSTEGDSFFVVFAGAHEAVAAAADAQRALAAYAWPGERPLRVRAGLHTAEAFRGPEPCMGLGVHLAARIAAAAHGGQVLLSATTRALLDRPPAGVRLVDLGEHRLKDFDASQRLFQLVVDGLPAEFPPVRALEAAEPAPVPRPATPTIGREAEIRAVCGRLTDPAVRLLTLTGPGGVGKTRLAVEVARRAAPAFDGGSVVGLASVSDPRDVSASLVRQLGARPDDAGAPLAAIARHLGGRRLLLVLDNLEHLLTAAPLIGELLDACPALTVLLDQPRGDPIVRGARARGAAARRRRRRGAVRRPRRGPRSRIHGRRGQRRRRRGDLPAAGRLAAGRPARGRPHRHPDAGRLTRRLPARRGSAAAPATRRNATAPSAPPSTGATSCSTPPSARPSPTWPSSPAGQRSAPQSG